MNLATPCYGTMSQNSNNIKNKSIKLNRNPSANSVSSQKVKRSGPKKYQGVLAPGSQPQRPGVFEATMAQQLSDPDSIDGIPELCPTRGGAQVVSRRYRRVIEYSPANDHFSVIMTPDLEAPGFITGKTTSILPVVPGALQGKPHGMPLAATRGGAYYGTLHDQLLQGIFKTDDDHILAQTSEITDAAAITLYGFDIVSTGYVTLTLVNDGDITATVYAHRLDTGTGNWTYWVAASLPSHGSQTWSVNASAFNALGFMNDKLGVRVTAIMAFSAAQITTSAVDHFAPAFIDQANELGVTAGRVLSMAMKVTNMSEKLKRKGAACCGRVPYNFHAWNNISSELSRRPRNRRYHGTADKGTRVFWIPEQADEWEFDNLHKKLQTYRESQYLISNFTGLDSDTSFLITFTWLVDFTLESQNFPLSTTPAWTDEFEHVVHLLAVADAATCNPLSANVFRNLLLSIKPYVESGVAHYKRHKPIYDYLMKQAAAMV